MNSNTLNILQLNSSGRRDESITRTLSNDLISALEDRHGAANIVRRDLDSNPVFVNAAWIEANFTPDEQKTQQHHDTLAYSNELVSELMNADTIVIGSDQVASLDGKLLGKPGSHHAALDQLEACQGREVVFHTAVCVSSDLGRSISEHVDRFQVGITANSNHSKAELMIDDVSMSVD